MKSATAQSRRFGPLRGASGLPLTPDMPLHCTEGSDWPEAEIAKHLLPDDAMLTVVLVQEGEQRGIDLVGPLLLCPVSASSEDDRLA